MCLLVGLSFFFKGMTQKNDLLVPRSSASPVRHQGCLKAFLCPCVEVELQKMFSVKAKLCWNCFLFKFGFWTVDFVCGLRSWDVSKLWHWSSEDMQRLGIFTLGPGSDTSLCLSVFGKRNTENVNLYQCRLTIVLWFQCKPFFEMPADLLKAELINIITLLTAFELARTKALTTVLCWAQVWN